MKDNKKENNGEFVPNIFEWLDLDQQKSRAKELVQKTQKNIRRL